MLRLLDLFSGIGGFSYAAEHLVGGFTTTQFVELDPFCQSILQRHWPDVPIHPDITTYTPTPGSHDIITAGFPCQDLSSAGKQAGLTGARSGLFYEILRVARVIRPQFLVLENVANLVSHANGATFQEVLYQIAKAGFDAEWAVIPASDVGACHRRARCWIVAYQPRQQALPPNTGSLHSPRWRTPEHMAGSPRTSEADRQQRQRHGNAADDCGEDAAVRLCPDWRSYVSEPVLRRGDDGLSGRLDRLKALGNAVVPHCAAIPLRRVLHLAQTQVPQPPPEN